MANKLPPVPVSSTGLFQPHESGWFIDLMSGDGVSPASFAEQPASVRLIIAICAASECYEEMSKPGTNWDWWEDACEEWEHLAAEIRKEMKNG